TSRSTCSMRCSTPVSATRIRLTAWLRSTMIRNCDAPAPARRRLAFLAQRHVLGAIGLFIMILFVLAALFADLICRYDPLTVDSAHALLHPDARHWMGTDSFGRDVWSRIIHGARISLAVRSEERRVGKECRSR